MPRVWLIAISLLLTQAAFSDPMPPAMPAGQLVREVVYNELHDHRDHSYWRYWVRKKGHDETVLEEQVETSQGPVARVARRNGHRLDSVAEQQEQERLQYLLSSPKEQARHLKQYEEDEQRIGKILQLLPDAFVYEYEGSENGCERLRFSPNPGYSAQSIEARIFHAMAGTICIDTDAMRLSQLDGRVQQNVDFGYGILGRLYQGGWFRLKRVQVSPSDWKTESLEVHLTVRALLVKSFARETSEQRGGFEPVPRDLDLAQGMALLEQTETRVEPQPEAGQPLPQPMTR